MIDRTAFLADAQKIVARLEKDLRARCDDMPEVGRAVGSEYRTAKDAGRTGQTLEEWRADAITQQAVAWVLSCVFVRFLEDNRLIDPPKISGPVPPEGEKGENRLARARDEHELFFTGARRGSEFTDREYLLSVFDELAKRPGTKDLYGPHNPIRAIPNWLSPDAAKDILLPFFQKIDAGSGLLVHDFTDPSFDTRFLGDLYQDLSEAARKKYALLQTPVFVEEFILDRTLLPAIETFGLATVKMIDPACGSGHFLLGGFNKLLELWVKKEPGTPPRELVQRALDAIHGVDLNPYAVAIARFRLLLAAWQAAGVTSLKNAPDFKLNLACGDSLLHGGRSVQKTLDEEVFGHTYQPEDPVELERLLRPGTYHAVVANPPYITPKDRGLCDQYRDRYSACHRQYSLSVPFMQRLFELACANGFIGQITANSFMKREFGKKIVEAFFPLIDLTHIIDSSGAHIPGHGIPTVILFGRNRPPVATTLRAVMGIRGEPCVPANPATGPVWSSIEQQVDQPGSQGKFVSVSDAERAVFLKHPWSIGGGGVADAKETIDQVSNTCLASIVESLGRTVSTQGDDVFVVPTAQARRSGIVTGHYRPLVRGEDVRDWQAKADLAVLFPYDTNLLPIPDDLSATVLRYLWPAKAVLASTLMFGDKTKVQTGLRWFEYGQFIADRLRNRIALVYSEVATHNHFAFDRGSRVFNRTAPIILLSSSVTEDGHFALLGLLNSSVAGFWLRQVCHDKGSSGITGGIKVEAWDRFFAFNGTNTNRFPLPDARPRGLAFRLDAFARNIADNQPASVIARWVDGLSLSSLLDSSEATCRRCRGTMIRLQEDLDWECYRLYGLSADGLTDSQWETRDLPVKLGERAFEIVLARKMRDEGLETTWFARHGSTPITELPAHWPPDYRKLVERRIEAIAANPQIALIEQPEYKRRWNDTPWAEKVTAALHDWLLARLESYFDIDGRMREDENLPQSRKGAKTEGSSLGDSAALREIRLYPLTRIADVASKDAEFREVGRLYREGRIDFDVTKLVTELVEAESVPLLPVLRYKPTGLDKRLAWERTWDLQRREDAIDARVAGKSVDVGAGGWTHQKDDGKSPLNPAQASLLKQYVVDPNTPQSIPVPPKYKSADFQKGDYWRLRGGLDVPKERWVLFPHCGGADGLPLVAWAGYDHLQLAKAIATHYVHVQEQEGGRDDPRLVPLLAAICQLLPWLKQWHNEMDEEFGSRMGDYYEGFVSEEARGMGKTVDEVCTWQPPAGGNGRSGRGRRAK